MPGLNCGMWDLFPDQQLNPGPASELRILATGQGKSLTLWVLFSVVLYGTFRESHTTLPTPHTPTPLLGGSLNCNSLCEVKCSSFWLAAYNLSQSLGSWKCTSVLSFWAAFPGLCHPAPALPLLPMPSQSEIRISGPLVVGGRLSVSWPHVLMASSSSASFSFFRSLRWGSHISPLTMCPNGKVLLPRSISWPR